jgi:hypothetical protein
MNETAISIVKFALRFDSSGSPWAQDAATFSQTKEVIMSNTRTAEENGKLRDRAKELEPLLEQLMEAYEELKSLLYNGGA